MISATLRHRLNRLCAVLLAAGTLLCGHAAQAQPVSDVAALPGASINSVCATANAQDAEGFTRALAQNLAGKGT